MIFSNLFKTKHQWQHKDATERIIAINDELSADNTEQLAILTDLIQNDSSDLVRRAALIKVGSFDAYVDAGCHNSQDKVKQFATKQIHDILTTNHSIVLTKSVKENILVEEAKKSFLGTALLEAWLAHEQDSDIMILLYTQISAVKKTSHLLTHSFSQKQQPEFQAHILKQVDDVKVLEKLSKKACNQDLAQQIQDKLIAIQEAIEKPQKLTKKIQLTLAKLQALKDINDYAEYKKRKALLITDWQLLLADFTVFSEEEAAEFNGKYSNIISLLDKLFIAKAESYQQQIIADKLAHDKQQDKKEFTQQINQISQGITTAVFSNEQFNEEHFKEVLYKLKANIRDSVLNQTEQKTFLLQVDELIVRLGKIPEIAESVSQATHLISRISQLTLPKTLDDLNDRQNTYNDWIKDWSLVEKKTAGILPDSIVQAKKQLVNDWQTGLRSLQNQQKELFFQHKKKLQDIKRLLNSGKYKVCFGLFKGVKANFHLLSSTQQHQLQRDFDQVSEKMVELSDWEHYIATPRKQELLEAIQALVDTPLDNPNEQATKVKAYRSTWNSLGHADEDVDKKFNDDFNELCEKAFAPCRAFYAEQDKIRDQHLVQRKKILTNAERIASELISQQETQTVDFKKIDGKLNNIQKEWSSAGEVDRNQYNKLQQQLKVITAPIKNAIHAFYQTNAQEKQALIVKAEALLSNDDIYSAIESAKGLQQAWRGIGFAGNQNERQLWQKFRETNDQLFEKRKQEKSKQQAEQLTIQAALEEKVIVIETSLQDVDKDNKQALESVKEQAETLLHEVVDHKPVIKSVAVRIDNVIKQTDKLIDDQTKAKEKGAWLNLFELMHLHANDNQNVDDLSTLPLFTSMTNFWQKRFQEFAKLTVNVQGSERFDKTLAIEILSKNESPAELANQRMKIQVQLMQEQMNSGAVIDLDALLVDWLMLGSLSSDDLPLIDRLKAIYCQ